MESRLVRLHTWLARIPSRRGQSAYCNRGTLPESRHVQTVCCRQVRSFFAIDSCRRLAGVNETLAVSVIVAKFWRAVCPHEVRGLCDFAASSAFDYNNRGSPPRRSKSRDRIRRSFAEHCPGSGSHPHRTMCCPVIRVTVQICIATLY